jgi:hypothetical protein
MPIYACECLTCGRQEDVYRPVAQYKDMPDCCGKMMEKRVTAPYVAPDIQPYRSMITGEMITSRSQHRAHLKAHKCIEIGNEIKHLTKNRKTEVELSPESKQRRKEILINKVSQLKG